MFYKCIFNPFPHIDAFWCLCSRQLFENLVTKEQFLLFPQCFLYSFPHTTILQQTTLNIFCQKIENLYNWMDNLWLKVENIVAKGEILVLRNFFFCHYFKKLSAAEASESVYMRERVNSLFKHSSCSTLLLTPI